MSSPKWRPFCLCNKVLIPWNPLPHYWSWEQFLAGMTRVSFQHKERLYRPKQTHYQYKTIMRPSYNDIGNFYVGMKVFILRRASSTDRLMIAADALSPSGAAIPTALLPIPIVGTLGCVFIDNETHESGATKCTTGEAWSAFSWHHSSVFHFINKNNNAMYYVTATIHTMWFLVCAHSVSCL